MGPPRTGNTGGVMQQKTVNLWTKEEYTYPVIGDFLPTLTSYVHEE
jgi:hypothetical protein